jgi:hypothetical protein
MLKEGFFACNYDHPDIAALLSRMEVLVPELDSVSHNYIKQARLGNLKASSFEAAQINRHPPPQVLRDGTESEPIDKYLKLLPGKALMRGSARGALGAISEDSYFIPAVVLLVVLALVIAFKLARRRKHPRGA